MKSKRFKSAKSDKLKMFFILSALILALVVYYGPVNVKGISANTDFILRTSILLVFIGIGIWSWLGTWYKIDDEMLIVKNSFLSYRIPIKSIHKIYLNQKTMHGTTKPTLSLKCIFIEYNKNQNISISPEPESQFIEMLLKVNPTIKTIEPKS